MYELNATTTGQIALGGRRADVNKTVRTASMELTVCLGSQTSIMLMSYVGSVRGKALSIQKTRTWVRSLGQEDPLEKEMATHSSTFAQKIPWMESTVHGVTKSPTQLSDFTFTFTFHPEDQTLKSGKASTGKLMFYLRLEG